MQFVGNKHQIYSTVLSGNAQTPELSVGEFQQLFGFLSSETEHNLVHCLSLSMLKVRTELAPLWTRFTDLTELSQDTFSDADSAAVLYKEAVFSLAAAHLIGVQLSTDATAEAAERQTALEQKKQQCEVHYRQAVDLLLNGKETLCFEVV